MTTLDPWMVKSENISEIIASYIQEYGEDDLIRNVPAIAKIVDNVKGEATQQELDEAYDNGKEEHEGKVERLENEIEELEVALEEAVFMNERREPAYKTIMPSAYTALCKTFLIPNEVLKTWHNYVEKAEQEQKEKSEATPCSK